ncbi:MAG: SDR family NAD(P)-dependent oxidoreductase [Verrucomicrobiota bacterium]
MESLQGKAAFVTGASSGIGRAIALALAANGVQVSLVARREDRLQEVSAAAGGDSQTQVLTADFRDEAQIVAAVDSAADHWGGLDILINSAGVALQASLVDGDTDVWREMLEVNVLGLAVASREALKHFDADRGGHVVNICSMSGHRVPGKGGFYAPTKFAVRAMTEGLRQELRLAGNPTRVSQISPGFVDTELVDKYFESAGANRYDAVDYQMLSADDTTAAVMHILTAPPHADITDILLRPTAQKT